MSRPIAFDPNGWEDCVYWQTQNRTTLDHQRLRHVNRLITNGVRDPFTGIGKPESTTSERKTRGDSLRQSIEPMRGEFEQHKGESREEPECKRFGNHEDRSLPSPGDDAIIFLRGDYSRCWVC